MGKQRKNCHLSMRISREERAKFHRVAQRHGLSLSAAIRQAMAWLEKTAGDPLETRRV